MNSEHTHDLERELIEIQKEIRNEGDGYARYAIDAGQKRAAYDLAKAKQMLQLLNFPEKRTVGEKEAMVDVAVEKELTDVRIAESLANASRERLKALLAELSAIQTRASLIKTERSLVGYGNGN